MNWSLCYIQLVKVRKGEAKILRSVTGTVPAYGPAPRHAWLAIKLG